MEVIFEENQNNLLSRSLKTPTPLVRIPSAYFSLSRCNIHPHHISGGEVLLPALVLNLQSFLWQPPVSANQLKSSPVTARRFYSLRESNEAKNITIKVLWQKTKCRHIVTLPEYDVCKSHSKANSINELTVLLWHSWRPALDEAAMSGQESF